MVDFGEPVDKDAKDLSRMKTLMTPPGSPNRLLRGFGEDLRSKI